MLVESIPLPPLPTAADLPDSDDTPVDNELQNLVPNLLLAILATIWRDRQDWFFGVDMGIYYLPTFPRKAIVPDGFLSLGVERRSRPSGRLSYVMWEEHWTAPMVVIEVVSQTYGGEYDTKMEKYLDLGVLYTVIYNPDHAKRDNHAPFEVYQRVEDAFVLRSPIPFRDLSTKPTIFACPISNKNRQSKRTYRFCITTKLTGRR